MLRVEAITLEAAYADAAKELNCSVTQLKIEVVQVPSNGFLGFFKKSAIIVAVVNETKQESKVQENETHKVETPQAEPKQEKQTTQAKASSKKEAPAKSKRKEKKESQRIINDTIMPTSFVSDQDDEDDDIGSGLEYTADYDDEFDETEHTQEKEQSLNSLDEIALEVKETINKLFTYTCFSIDSIEVSTYDEQTLLVEFKGGDAALLIGKEGYRYKALSYMIFNWINAKYDVQLRLEIAEFLHNQEESMSRYLESVYENVQKDGRAQTKILDGVLVQIALKELRNKYTDKYVVIRTTRDGLKYIIINDYNH